jgi:hypothetical protein
VIVPTTEPPRGGRRRKEEAMAYLTVHHLPGDPGELRARKQQRFDPVVGPLARRHGAILSLTADAEDGLLVVNLWDSPSGAAALREEPDALRAQQEARLPLPSRFEHYERVQVDDFR